MSLPLSYKTILLMVLQWRDNRCLSAVLTRTLCEYNEVGNVMRK